jgi:outer membrane immunogenic protein
MRNRSLSPFAGAAIGLTSSQVALAADLARPLPPAPVYIPPAPIPYIWTGCYVGGNIGGARSNVEVNNVSTGGTASASNSGGVRSAAITKRAGGCLAFAICSTRQA